MLAYPLSPEGSPGQKRVLVTYPSDAGPDGFAVDRAGRLYVAVRDEKAPGIGVYAPDGNRVDFIRTPEVPSNVEFARPPADDLLYITAGGSLYRVRTAQRGFFPAAFHR